MNRYTAAAAAVFCGAGASHFAKPDFFESVVPDWWPNPTLTNQVSGAAEIALGLGLLAGPTRKAAGWGLLLLLAIVFPANIDMALKNVAVTKDETGTFQRRVGEMKGPGNWIRLPFQAVFGALIWKGAGLQMRSGPKFQ